MLSSREQLPPIRRAMMKSNLSQGKQTKRAKIGAYIDQTLDHINKGCYKEGKLCIDGGFGDYRMSIFRKKDKKKRFEETPSSFNDTFLHSLDRLSPELKEEFNKIIKRKNQDYLEKQSTTIDSEENRPKLAVWNNQDEGYMYHQYVPNYQKQRWFKKVTPLPDPEQPKNQSTVVEKKPTKKRLLQRRERTHFFSYMDNNAMSFLNSN